MNIVKNTVNLGISKPFKILHMTDSHLVAADYRENERKQKLAESRGAFFPEATKNYKEITEYGRNHCEAIVCTGDLIDFVSEKACEILSDEWERNRFIFAVGNHEFSLYVGEAKEDFAYKMKNYTKIQNCLPGNIDFSSTVINEVNFVTLDNSYYNFTNKQLALLKTECERKYPIVLCMHTPIFHKEFFDYMQQGDNARPAYLCGSPEALIARYEPSRYEQQKADSETIAFIEYLTGASEVKLILAGHAHENFECAFENGLLQFATAGTYSGAAREIEFR